LGNQITDGNGLKVSELRSPEDLAVEWVLDCSIRSLNRLVLEAEVHSHAECHCGFAYPFPCHTDGQFSEAVALLYITPEGVANGLKLVRGWAVSCGLAPFYRQAILILSSHERRTVDPSVLLDLRSWYMTQDMMPVRNRVTLRHAAAP
jgi:hypothetical protein